MKQFKDPMKFINSIKDEAEKFGICRIIPPSGWDKNCMEKNMKFEDFVFETKCQKVNQMQNRKGNCVVFVDELKRFWKDIKKQPINFQPMIDKRPLDLWSLFLEVENRGGYIDVCQEKKWKDVCLKLKISPHYKNGPSVLQKNYQRLIQPYIDYLIMNPDVKSRLGFMEGITLAPKKIQYNTRASRKFKENVAPSHGKKRKRLGSLEDTISCTPLKSRKSALGDGKVSQSSWKDVRLRSFIPSDNKVDCLYCSLEKKGKIIYCEKCSYNNAHLECIVSSRGEDVNTQDSWVCDICLKGEAGDNEEWAYGYEEGKSYSLDEYQRVADRFSEAWFQDSKSMPTASDIEREYWDIVQGGQKLVHVHYGSDLDVQEHASGFPLNPSYKSPETKRWKETIKAKKKEKWVDRNSELMRTIGWNLNNLPYASVLKHLNQSIAGVTRPMMYVGMLFSSFCWHTEDNWLYSINYVHKGAQKLWYGIPGSCATVFENAMKREFPERFELEPNLLHLLVTMLSPDKLKEYNVPVCTTVQNEGEFVITFPRAYHAGFNTGFNVAESVNFAVHDWLSWGHRASQEYRFNRSSVFPFEEVLLNICLDADDIKSAEVLNSANIEVKRMMEDIQKLMKIVESAGVNIKRPMTQKNGDCEQCEACGYDCYLFGVKCECSLGQIFCLQHFDYHCKCVSAKKYVVYRKPLEQLLKLTQSLESIATSLE